LLSAAASITFTFNFSVNAFANSVPSIVIFNFGPTGAGVSGNAAGVSVGTVASSGGAAQSGGNSVVGSLSTVSSTGAITPISPSLFSSSPATGEEPIEYLFFTPQTVVHLGASSAPATAQHVTAQGIEQETPMATGNLFGQSLNDTVSGMANPRMVPASSLPSSSSLIDEVEPAEAVIEAPPAKPVERTAPPPRQDQDEAPKPKAPEVQPELKPDAKAAELPNLELDAALALMAPLPEVGPTAQDQAIASASDSTPRFVGAAVLTVSGYTLMLGQADRFRDGRFRNGQRRRRSSDTGRFEPSVR
jgi:hypothetical protein